MEGGWDQAAMDRLLGVLEVEVELAEARGGGDGKLWGEEETEAWAGEKMGLDEILAA